MNRAIFPAVTVALSAMVFAGVWTITDPARAVAAPDTVAAIPTAPTAGVPPTEREALPIVPRAAPAAVRRTGPALAPRPHRAPGGARHHVPRRAVPLAATGASDVFYPGCRAVRAAGMAPLYRGQPGYRREMDGDNDGIACEPYRGG